MRTLTFEQIVDDRFDDNIENLLAKRVNKLMSLFKEMDGVHVFHDGLYLYIFKYDGIESRQYRCRFYIRKDGRKYTWNDIYKVVNSVKAARYEFLNFDWNGINA